MADQIEEATLEEFINEPEPQKPRLIMVGAATFAVLLIAAVVGSIQMLGRAPNADGPDEKSVRAPGSLIQTADDMALAAVEAARAAAEGDLPTPEPETALPHALPQPAEATAHPTAKARP